MQYIKAFFFSIDKYKIKYQNLYMLSKNLILTIKQISKNEKGLIFNHFFY